jgi:hypothetical protein
MNAIIAQNFGPLSTRFAPQVGAVNELAAGITTGFGIVGYKGKVWSIRYRGDETQLMRDDGDGPRGSIEVVILKSSAHISKIFYEGTFVEGSNAPPDCFSTNGVVPDVSVANKRSGACASCPMNAWGSRITPSGKQGKACSDSKRMAIVPAADINNEVFGGPMLLRVPAASLQELATFGNKLAGLGYPSYAIAARIAFDPAQAYPKFTFGAIRPLNDQEADAVLALRDDIQVSRILAEGTEYAAPAAASVTAASMFEQPPVKAAPVQVAPVQVAPVQVAPVQVAPAPQPVYTPPPVTTAAPVQVAPVTTVSHGFGGPVLTQPALVPATAEPTQVHAAPVQEAAQDNAAPSSDLEAELDAKLAALFG